MKTLIVGAGVIGVIYGWALSEGGVDVTHFVRTGKKERLKDGINLDLLDERKHHPKYNVTHYAIKCIDRITEADTFDLIIVPTNAHQTEEALKQLVPVSGNACFLILSSNWEGVDFIDRLLPRERYLMGYADGGGTIRDGVYWSNLGAEIHLGTVDASQAANLEAVKALFERADIKADIPGNFLHWLWVHNAGVIGFAAGFAKHRQLKPYLKDKAMLRECILSTKELYELCRLRGVALKDYPEVSMMNFPIWLVILLLRWNFTHNESMQRYTAHAASESNLIETKMHYNAMMKTADELGFNMPHTRTVGGYL